MLTPRITSLISRTGVLVAIAVASLALIAASPAAAKPRKPGGGYAEIVVHGNGPGKPCEFNGDLLEDGSTLTLKAYDDKGNVTFEKSYTCTDGTWVRERTPSGPTTGPGAPLGNAP